MSTVKIGLNLCVWALMLKSQSGLYPAGFVPFVQVTYLVLTHHRVKSKSKQCLLRTFDFALSCSFNSLSLESFVLIFLESL